MQKPVRLSFHFKNSGSLTYQFDEQVHYGAIELYNGTFLKLLKGTLDRSVC